MAFYKLDTNVKHFFIAQTTVPLSSWNEKKAYEIELHIFLNERRRLISSMEKFLYVNP